MVLCGPHRQTANKKEGKRKLSLYLVASRRRRARDTVQIAVFVGGPLLETSVPCSRHSVFTTDFHSLFLFSPISLQSSLNRAMKSAILSHKHKHAAEVFYGGALLKKLIFLQNNRKPSLSK